VRAAVMTGPGQIELVDRVSRPPRAEEVRLKVEQCGVCTSDLDLWQGRGQEEFPVAIGHEVAGRIEDVGGGVGCFRLGDRVAAWVEGDGFADEVTVAERFCVPVEEEVAYPAVAEPLACIVNAVELCAPPLGADVTVIGAGYMGNLLQLVSALKGPRSITVIDMRADALKRADALSSVATVSAAGRSPGELARQVAAADVTYEVTGTQSGLELAGELTTMGGKLCIVGYHLGGNRSVPLARWNWMAFQIINAHFRDPDVIMRGMRAGMRLVNAGVLNPAPLISDTQPLERISRTFEMAAERPAGFCKAVISPSL
jgi:L-iditol 2-dehydrogenase